MRVAELTILEPRDMSKSPLVCTHPEGCAVPGTGPRESMRVVPCRALDSEAHFQVLLVYMIPSVLVCMVPSFFGSLGSASGACWSLFRGPGTLLRLWGHGDPSLAVCLNANVFSALLMEHLGHGLPASPHASEQVPPDPARQGEVHHLGCALQRMLRMNIVLYVLLCTTICVKKWERQV